MPRQEIIEQIEEIENRPLHSQSHDDFTRNYRHIKFLKAKLETEVR